MNILITGSNGQLGNEIRNIHTSVANSTFFFTDVEELNITDAEAILAFCKTNTIDTIINCAAYTAVDKAEDEPETASLVNTKAVENLAKAARACEAKIIHISTDYVFDGTAHEPYRETNICQPNSVYGHTKREGELKLLDLCPDGVIIRTSWLYSTYGNNFVKTIMRFGQEREQLKVVFDQIGTPTYAADLAQAILAIVDQKCAVGGIFHFSNEGVCSWYDFAISILKKKEISCLVNPVVSTEFPTKAIRPKYSVLNKKHIKESYQLTIPHWEDALDRCLKTL